MYHFAKQKEVNILSKWCIEVIHKVQIEVSDYFTFDFSNVAYYRYMETTPTLWNEWNPCQIYIMAIK